MQTTSMNVAIVHAISSASSVERMPAKRVARLPKFAKALFAWYALPKVRKTAFVMADVCSKLRVAVLSVQRNGEDELLDQTMAVRDSLESMKVGIRESRDSMRASYRDVDPEQTEMPVLSREVATLLDLMSELYEVATELQWSLAEHDASFSRRLEGFSADSKAALDEMLRRISVGA
jgi:hypothetical protein